MYFHIGSDASLFDVSLLIFLEVLTADRGDEVGGDVGLTFSGCVRVGVCFTFGARACAHVRSLENFTDEQRPSFFFPPLNPIFSTKEMKETITHTLCQTLTRTQRPASVTHTPSHSEKQFLKLTRAILLSDVNALGFKRAHAHTHTQPQWQALSRTQTHSSLFSDKGLLLQLCHDSTKDFLSKKRGLNRDLVADWVKSTNIVLLLFLSSLSLFLISPPPYLSLSPPPSPPVEVQYLRAGSHLPLCSGVPL